MFVAFALSAPVFAHILFWHRFPQLEAHALQLQSVACSARIIIF
jgi:hypothetical protein